jgi:DUF1365 family protein
MSLRSALYLGDITHRRLRTRQHRLRYRLCYLLIDLDELPTLARRWLFGVNRAALLAWRDADHGAGDGRPFRDWLQEQLVAHGLTARAWRFEVLCLPRVLGYVFNPITVVYCHDGDDLVAMVYEVNNTFGDRIHYLMPTTRSARRVTRHDCAKAMFVSPFFDVQGRYQFDLTPAGETLGLSIRYLDDDGLRLHAAFHGCRLAWSAAALRGMLASFPLATFKVMAGIHWEALRLWLKRIPLHTRPKAPESRPHV